MTMITGTIGRSNIMLADPNSGIRSNGYNVYWPLVPDTFRVGKKTLQLNGAIVGGRNEIQSVTIANATGGTFILTALGFPTAAIVYNPTAQNIQDAINTAVGAVAVRVSGTGPFYVEFVGDYAMTNVATMTANIGALTGGGTQAVNIATPVTGVAAPATITVDALAEDITSGSVVNFGTGRVAYLSRDAVAGDLTVYVSNLNFDLADNTVGTIPGTGPKVLTAGTVVGKAGSPSGKEIFPRVLTSNPAMGIVIEDIVEGNRSAGRSGHGVYEGGLFWENRLPDAVANGGTLPSAIKTELGARFGFNKMGEDNAPTW